jgi:hypothetical protein
LSTIYNVVSSGGEGAKKAHENAACAQKTLRLDHVVRVVLLVRINEHLWQVQHGARVAGVTPVGYHVERYLDVHRLQGVVRRTDDDLSERRHEAGILQILARDVRVALVDLATHDPRALLVLDRLRHPDRRVPAPHQRDCWMRSRSVNAPAERPDLENTRRADRQREQLEQLALCG